MKRRRFLVGLSVVGATVTSGCLSAARTVVECSPQSEWGVFVANLETDQIELDVTITRRNRDVFSDTITLPAAEREHGPTGSSVIRGELAFEPDVLTNLRQYTVDISHEGEPLEIMTNDGNVAETEFRPTCEHMLIRYRGPTSWATAPVTVTSVPPERAERWREAMDE